MTKLSVCIGSACHVKGAYNVISTFRHLIEEYALHERVDFQANFCSKACSKPGVSVSLDGEKQVIAPEDARRFFLEAVLPRAKNEASESARP